MREGCISLFLCFIHLVVAMKVYVPLIVLVLSVIALTEIIVHALLGLPLARSSWMIWMQVFMGVWFFLFAMVKLFDLPWFVKSFQLYNLASVIPGYAWLFPFIEIALGIAYLVDIDMQYALLINVIAFVVIAEVLISLLYTLVIRQQKPHCACMGMSAEMSVGAVTVIENIVMLVMILSMVWGMM